MTYKNAYRHCAPDRFRVRLHISYDGTDFNGWQRQTKLVSVQGTVESAVKQLFGEELSVVGASRTDSGVHAQMQVAHFDALKDPRSFRDLRYSLQCLTPDSVVIKDAFLAPNDFHAIATSIDKTYRYSVLNRRVPSALRHRTTWWVRQPLNLERLNEAAQLIVGTHDFKSFQTMGTEVDSTIRTVSEAYWRLAPTSGEAAPRGGEPPDTLEFIIRGEGFLKQMVRNLVGTMIDLELNQQPPTDLRSILEAQDRRKAGNTAPPQGLFLVQVRYPPELDNRCIPL